MSEDLRRQAGYGKGGEGGMSRAAQFVTYLIRHFEELRTWREYRSPYGLRYTIALCTHILPAVLAPMWKYYALNQRVSREGAPADTDGEKQYGLSWSGCVSFWLDAGSIRATFFCMQSKPGLFWQGG